MKHVTFEIAKLLKEKGFNDGADYWYSVEGSLYHVNESNNCSGYIPDHSCDAATISDVVDWLRVNYGIWISVHLEMCRGYEGYDFNFEYINDKKRTIKEQEIQYKTLGETVFNTPSEAYLTGIKYTLNNLI